MSGDRQDGCPDGDEPLRGLNRAALPEWSMAWNDYCSACCACKYLQGLTQANSGNYGGPIIQSWFSMVLTCCEFACARCLGCAILCVLVKSHHQRLGSMHYC